jgi:hypothetical protein
MNDTTTLIVTELLDCADRAPLPPQPTPIALALPEEAVEDLAEAA